MYSEKEIRQATTVIVAMMFTLAFIAGVMIGVLM